MEPGAGPPLQRGKRDGGFRGRGRGRGQGFIGRGSWRPFFRSLPISAVASQMVIFLVEGELVCF